MEYRVGMKVRIVDYFDYSDPMGVNAMMERKKGMIATIESMGSNRNGQYYRLDIDDGNNYWTERMIKPLAVNKGKHSIMIKEGIGVKKLIIPNSYQALSVGTSSDLFLREYTAHWYST